MTTLNFAETLRRPLLLASAAFLLHAGASWAGDVTADPQAQAQALLGGRTPERMLVARAPAEQSAALPTVDPQEQARRLILGAGLAHPPGAVRPALPQAARGEHLARSNPQALARQMILGNRG